MIRRAVKVASKGSRLLPTLPPPILLLLDWARESDNRFIHADYLQNREKLLSIQEAIKITW